MIESLSADSNILIYAFDPTDAAKHRTSMAIMEAMTLAESMLPMQCLVEFYSVTVRKRFLTPEDAAALAQDLIDNLTIVSADVGDFLQAMTLQRTYGIQSFDALLLSTALRGGYRVLLSEDMQHGQTYGHIQVLNPFQLTEAELDELLA